MNHYQNSLWSHSKWVTRAKLCFRSVSLVQEPVFNFLLSSRFLQRPPHLIKLGCRGGRKCGCAVIKTRVCIGLCLESATEIQSHQCFVPCVTCIYILSLWRKKDTRNVQFYVIRSLHTEDSPHPPAGIYRTWTVMGRWTGWSFPSLWNLLSIGYRGGTCLLPCQPSWNNLLIPILVALSPQHDSVRQN